VRFLRFKEVYSGEGGGEEVVVGYLWAWIGFCGCYVRLDCTTRIVGSIRYTRTACSVVEE
jgi:hypothetical protein